MGYETEYSLTVKNVRTKEDFAYLAYVMEQAPYKLIYYVFDAGYYDKDTQTAYFYTWEMQKWYTHGEDMIALSEQFPAYTFRLHGSGEDKGDLWYRYFRNGEDELCEAKVEYPMPTVIKWPEAVSDVA